MEVKGSNRFESQFFWPCWSISQTQRLFDVLTFAGISFLWAGGTIVHLPGKVWGVSWPCWIHIQHIHTPYMHQIMTIRFSADKPQLFVFLKWPTLQLQQVSTMVLVLHLLVLFVSLFPLILPQEEFIQFECRNYTDFMCGLDAIFLGIQKHVHKWFLGKKMKSSCVCAFMCMLYYCPKMICMCIIYLSLIWCFHMFPSIHLLNTSPFALPMENVFVWSKSLG